ncbi:F0F1 ATP synthase subunit B [Oleiphilus sp. HI0071]|uniref:F0F1 ATP synthase subunit B n=1 Tax=unclassified Oleiphilus TaxID=2631174 RepID=UPI0007C3ABCB|nr:MULTISPECIES: F0F1 ATP synthase subunit B [unclassified Oleiphilus]KZY68112.1 F0F1 ATP synthase subunit B [Oleiphilus sp. HI0065]KZY82303.1 F0F1 ATP synthase subunit B [Oleiphilus sp. HI0071]KZZ01420.1 F0F1 ATP synthase subunit B [Oleiphilus sp. HI0073]KZZ39869.1 F0F1 ATP synthase subunit B [Oleiphilus sp. HI0118]KZZ51698.1 F0F1 ATP synthase subunit B [Oleiphilus sp. HI0122]KZZ63903.1 F0F1 ATP synthase subunit B [Oleiphilus sp. HI0130]KZZ77373.1 F0F1 ATP synthase subunit B [Oleiphilus sp.
MNINYTLIGQIIFFAVFVLFCMKYVWPPIMAAMQEREKKISDGLAAADRASKDLELAQKKAGEELKDAKVQAAELIEQANKRASQIVDEAKENAKKEGDRLLTAAQAEIEQEKNRVREELRAEVSAIALAGAEKILGSEIDASKHSKLLDQLASEI